MIATLQAVLIQNLCIFVKLLQIVLSENQNLQVQQSEHNTLHCVLKL